jgi:hypothetical protein
MSGLALKVGGFGGTAATTAPQYGSAPSYASGVTGTSAAFGSGFTTPTATTGEIMSASHPAGAATWFGVAAIVGLIAIRHSLPN